MVKRSIESQKIPSPLPILLALAIGLSACAPGPERPPLDPVPRPELDGFEAVVQEQLSTAFDTLDQHLADAATPLVDLASAHGEVGRLLQAYELDEGASVAYDDARRLDGGSFRWAYLHGTVLQNLGRLDEAIAAFEVAHGLNGRDLPTLVRLGQALHDANRLDEARQRLEAALELDSETALAHYFLGQVEMDTESWTAAVESLERALELQPSASIVHNALARAHRGLGDGEKARFHVERIGQDEVRLADPLLAEVETLEISSAAHLRRAGRAQLAGDDEAALAEYRRAVEADPRSADARAGLGGLLASLGRGDEALEELRNARRLGGNSALVLYNLAGAHRILGDTDAAVATYREALELDGDYLDARYALAQTLAQAGRTAEAETEYRQILENQPDQVRAHFELAMQLRQERPGEALALLEAALEADPTPKERALVQRQRGALAQSRGDYDTALAAYRDAVEVDPNDADTHFAFANLLGAAGEFRGAAGGYVRVLELDPEHRAARLGAATALNLAGEAKGAASVLAQGLELHPGDPDMAHALARLLATTRNDELRNGQRALELVRIAARDGGPLDLAETMAMAYAEMGQFDEAMGWQQKVIDELEGANRPDLLAGARQRMESYRRNQPIRQ